MNITSSKDLEEYLTRLYQINYFQQQKLVDKKKLY